MGKFWPSRMPRSSQMGLDGGGNSLPVEKDNNFSQNPHGCASDGPRGLSLGPLSRLARVISGSAAQDGSGLRQLTTGRYDDAGACSPDGKWVFYISGTDRTCLKVPLSGRETPEPWVSPTAEGTGWLST